MPTASNPTVDRSSLTVLDMFNALRQQRIQYVVLDNWDSLPSTIVDNKLHILTSNHKALLQTFNATRVRGAHYRFTPRGSSKAIDLWVREKGKNFLPEKFESELLHRTSLHHETVSIPEARCAIALVLYRALYHEGRYPNITERRVIQNFIDERVGIPTAPDYNDVGLLVQRLM